MVDCDRYKALCEAQGVAAYPALRYYIPDGPSKGTPIDSNNRQVDHSTLLELWAQGLSVGLKMGGADTLLPNGSYKASKSKSEL